MIRLSVPEIEGGSPERHGGEEEEGEGLVLEYSSSWMLTSKNEEYKLEWASKCQFEAARKSPALQFVK